MNDNTKAAALANEIQTAIERVDALYNSLKRLTKMTEIQGFFGWVSSQHKPNPAYVPAEFDPETGEETSPAQGKPTVQIDLNNADDRQLKVPGTNITYGQIVDANYGLTKLVEWMEATGSAEAVNLANTAVAASRPRALR